MPYIKRGVKEGNCFPSYQTTAVNGWIVIKKCHTCNTRYVNNTCGYSCGMLKKRKIIHHYQVYYQYRTWTIPVAALNRRADQEIYLCSSFAGLQGHPTICHMLTTCIPLRDSSWKTCLLVLLDYQNRSAFISTMILAFVLPVVQQYIYCALFLGTLDLNIANERLARCLKFIHTWLSYATPRSKMSWSSRSVFLNPISASISKTFSALKACQCPVGTVVPLLKSFDIFRE